MNLVDSCGWLEYFADSDRADLFEPAILDVDHLVVPSICLFEVFKVLLRELGRDIALVAAGTMRQAQVVDLDVQLAIEAADIAVRLRMPTADSIVLATAQRYGAEVWTQDADFDGRPGVRFFRKP